MTHTSCTREGCQVASSGKCLEGFDPVDTCPYAAVSTPSGDEGAVSAAVSAFVDLPTGEALSELQAAEVTRQATTRVIVLAGPSGSGKTTILTSLFEGFLEAPFANYLFAGSRTLAGFERRCHDARTLSERKIAHTVHTQVEASDFLHLAVSVPSGNFLGPMHLLLSDVSGERFRALRDSTDAVRNMGMLKRADHLCVVVDGAKLVDSNERYDAQTDARMLLRCIVQEQVLAPSCKIQIVFSKWDVIMAHSAPEEVLSFVEKLRTLLQKAADNTPIQFFEVAARPQSKRLPFAFGLPTLFHVWVDQPVVPPRPNLYMPARHGLIDQSNCFANAIVEHQGLGEFYDVRWV
jgi:double-GTPase-like protein